ncbi:uncharacterized protein PRCAT00004042001 [Priceomyces carsonii]|uniref:uncharacterized protein n=1 Tax=Priceomyces carsonii TaxID=28549 RepID=UPI002EDA03E2|nr:unnamed protein product [Priceomyces carsonii]
MERKAFLDQEAPAGYVAGIGRGATGFTTSADTTAITSAPLVPPKEDDNNEDEDEDDILDNNVDLKDETGLLAVRRNDKEDEEADKIYDEIDRRMQTRNKRRVEPSDEAEDREIKEQFSDLKMGLSNVTADEWENLPEPGDLTRKNKRTRLLEQQNKRFYAVPDAIIAGSGSMGSLKEGSTNFETISAARDKLLSLQLDSLVRQDSSTVEDQYDPVLEQETDLDDQIADIERSRLILTSLRRTEPNKANSWIASARLEERAKNFTLAKKLIVNGCHKVPNSEDIWLESIRIHQKSSESTKLCKRIVQDALKVNAKSEKLWLKAFELEHESDVVSRRRILMRALEYIPSSAELWRDLIGLEEDTENIKKLLNKAVELCPKYWDLWQSLINLSGYEDAKSVLNRARRALNNYYKVWVTATKLEERENPSVSPGKLTKLMEKAFKSIYENKTDGETLSARRWLEEAAEAENEGFTITCQAIVFNALKGFDIENDFDNATRNLLTEAKFFTEKSNFETSNFIYQWIIETYPNNINSWTELFSSLKRSGNDLKRLYDYYEKAIELNPEIELLRLMYAKDKWVLGNDVEKAREILEEGTKSLPQSEEIWLARVKLEIKNDNFKAAQRISSEVLEAIPGSSPRVWFKHIHLLRFLEHNSHLPSYEEDILSATNEALDRFPSSEKLYLQKGQILLHDLAKPDRARDTFSSGVKECPSCIELWIYLSKVDEVYLNSLIRARSVFDNAILKNPSSDVLWREKLDLERRCHNLIAARQINNKALKEHPSSSVLWVQHLSLISKTSEKKTALLDSLKSTNNSAKVLLHVGVIFWHDNKYSKARSWFERALSSDKTNGDAWAWLYLFLKNNGTETEMTDLIKDFSSNSDGIRKGDRWNATNKDPSNLNKSPREILDLVSQTLIRKH